MTPHVLAALMVVLLGASVIGLIASVRSDRGRRRADDLVGDRDRPQAPVPEALREHIDRAALGVSASTVVSGWVAVIVLAAGFGLLNGLLALGCFAVVATIVVPGVALWLLRHRRDRQIEAELPTALESIGRSVRSGASFAQAIAESVRVLRGPLRNELVAVDRALTLGQPLAAVLREWSDRRDLPGVRLAAAALIFSYESGGIRSRAIDGLASSLRDKIALEREVAALASQSRMSGLVISLLPVGFVAVSSTLDPQVASFLFGTVVGLVCLSLGLMLDAIGFVWMHRLTSAIR